MQSDIEYLCQKWKEQIRNIANKKNHLSDEIQIHFNLLWYNFIVQVTLKAVSQFVKSKRKQRKEQRMYKQTFTCLPNFLSSMSYKMFWAMGLHPHAFGDTGAPLDQEVSILKCYMYLYNQVLLTFFSLEMDYYHGTKTF